MNTYLISTPLDDFGSFEETKIQASYFDDNNGFLRLVLISEIDGIKKFETIASFAPGFWSRVTKENTVE